MKIVTTVFRWVLIGLTPILLLTTAVQIVFTPIYPQLEYRAPGFPPDLYGFSLQERLHWSKISIDYVLDRPGIALNDQRLPNGTPLYNERELSHMEDVKHVFSHMVWWWRGLAGAFILAGIFLLIYRKDKNSLATILRSGGWMTVLVMLLIIVFTIASFNLLFTQFHRLFFQGDSWIFLYSDSLIRLFPIRFWQDAFILVGIITLVEAGVIIWIGKKLDGRC